jgi:hypothetical protein
VQAPIPQISGLHSQENHIIETFKEEGSAFSTQKPLRGEDGMMEHLTRLSAPRTDSCPHPQIANELAGGNDYNVNL